MMTPPSLRVVSTSAVPDTPHTPTADRIARFVDGFSRTSYLPPATELAAAADEIDAALAPASERIVERAIAVMVSGYPSFRPEPLYIAALVSDLAGYPVDVVMAATAEIRRTLRFAPTHAEILTVAEAKIAGRRRLRHRIGLALAETGRRQRAADVVEHEQRVETERVAGIERRLIDALGGVIAPGTYAKAERYLRWNRPLHVIRRFAAAAEWEEALTELAPWAIATMQAAALITETFDARLNMTSRMRILELADSDLQAGRQELRRLAAEPDDDAILLPPRADWSRDVPAPLLALLERLIDRHAPEATP